MHGVLGPLWQYIAAQYMKKVEVSSYSQNELRTQLGKIWRYCRGVSGVIFLLSGFFYDRHQKNKDKHYKNLIQRTRNPSWVTALFFYNFAPQVHSVVQVCILHNILYNVMRKIIHEEWKTTGGACSLTGSHLGIEPELAVSWQLLSNFIPVLSSASSPCPSSPLPLPGATCVWWHSAHLCLHPTPIRRVLSGCCFSLVLPELLLGFGSSKTVEGVPSKHIHVVTT